MKDRRDLKDVDDTRCTQAELKIAADESLNKEYLPVQGQDLRITIGP